MAEAKPWWVYLLDFLAGLLAKEQARAAGATPGQMKDFQVFMTPLGSGYSTEAERETNRAKLKSACDAAVLDPSLAPQGETTHCSQAASQIARAMGYYQLDGLLADGQIVAMGSAAGWREETGPDKFQRASDHAQAGGIAFAAAYGLPHGHIAAIYPASLEPSGTWGVEVPIVANVGEHNGVMRLSQAFRLSQRPALRIFLWGQV